MRKLYLKKTLVVFGRAAAPGGDISLIRTCDVDQVTNPILHNLVSSFEHFYSKFSKKDGNYKEA